MNKYQAVIIGFDKARKTLAVTLAETGWRVALIEQSNAMYGGTCINIGCVPTKTLVHDTRQRTDFARAIQRKNEMVSFLRNKNFHNLADMPNINVIDGQAEFINNHSLCIHRPGRNLGIHGEKVFTSTGAQAVAPPIPGITTTPGVYDSTELLNLKGLPGRLGVLGGGYIGVEFASVFANFGNKVTILEVASLFLSREGRDIADNIATILYDQGVDIILNTHMERVSRHENQVQVHSEHAQLAVDTLLVASDRQPATASLHPEDVGIAVNERGAIVVDRQLHTAVDNIWVMGDVIGGLQFVYISLDDYCIVRDELLGKGRCSANDRENVPYSVSMTPPLSRVGMTEGRARGSGADIQVVTLPVAIVPRARVTSDTRGVLKVIVDNRTQRILGASLLYIGSHGMINIVKMVMDTGLPYSIPRDQIFTHPSMNESLNDLLSLVK